MCAVSKQAEISLQAQASYPNYGRRAVKQPTNGGGGEREDTRWSQMMSLLMLAGADCCHRQGLTGHTGRTSELGTPLRLSLQIGSPSLAWAVAQTVWRRQPLIDRSVLPSACFMQRLIVVGLKPVLRLPPSEPVADLKLVGDIKNALWVVERHLWIGVLQPEGPAPPSILSRLPLEIALQVASCLWN
jgi:hypothetical protein